MTFNVNDILYTKDGRKCGNLCVIAVDPAKVTCISDYGNIVSFYPSSPKSFPKQFYKTLGKAGSTHKHHNYYLNHPEALI